MSTPPDLRPRSLRDLVDRAFELYRQEARLLLPLALTFNAATFIVSRSLRSGLGQPALDLSSSAEDFITAAPVLVGDAVAHLLFGVLAAGALTFVLDGAFWGRAVTARSLFARLAARLPPLAIMLALIGLTLIGLIALPAMLALLLLPSPWSTLIGFGCFLSFSTLALYLGLRWGLSPPVVLLEERSPLSALRRSRALLQIPPGRPLGENPWLRLAVVFGVPFAFQLVIVLAVQVGLSSLQAANLSRATSEALSEAAAVFVTLTASMIQPLVWALLLLVYYDLRIRREGLDLEHRAAALTEEPCPRS